MKFEKLGDTGDLIEVASGGKIIGILGDNLEPTNSAVAGEQTQLRVHTVPEPRHTVFSAQHFAGVTRNTEPEPQHVVDRPQQHCARVIPEELSPAQGLLSCQTFFVNIYGWPHLICGKCNKSLFFLKWSHYG